MAASNTKIPELAKLLPDVGRDLRLKVGVLYGATHTTAPKEPKDGKKRKKQAQPTTIQVAEYAIYNEYGTQRIPSRPFMRFSLDTFAESAWIPELAQLIKEGMDPETAFNRVGLQAQADVRRVIEAWKEPENKKSTIRHKRSGRDNPLVDTGDLLDAIDYELEGAGA